MRLAVHAAPPPQRRFVDTAPRQAEWQAIHRVADTHYGAIRQLFALAWEVTAERLPLGELARALRLGDTPAVLMLVEQAFAETADLQLREQLRSILAQIVEQSVVASQPALTALLTPQPPGLAITFGVPNALVLAYVQDRTGTLIHGVKSQTVQGIRAAIVQNMQAGRSWRSLVPEIQTIIGVTERQADALWARRLLLQLHGASDQTIERLLAQKARQYKRLRARTIARHETMDAANAGQYMQWQQLVAHGALAPLEYRRFWVVTPDDRTCRLCRPIPQLNREGVGLLDLFDTPQGAVGRPPAHVACRCAQTLRRRAEG